MKSVRVAVVLLALASSALASSALAETFSIYPGAKKNPDIVTGNPDHATSYSTPDAFQKVVDYYKVRGKLGKVTEIVPGMFGVDVHFDDGNGILVQGFREKGGTTIVVPPTKKN